VDIVIPPFFSWYDHYLRKFISCPHYLGFIGEEFETARMHLTKRLPGNAAWRRAA
jgi:hypothetical protein